MILARASSMAVCISAVMSSALLLVDRVAHALFGEAEDHHAGLEVGARAHRVEHGHVHALEHGGQDRARVEVVLVRIDADRLDARVRRRLEHAEAGAAGCREDDVGALADLGAGELAPLHRVVPGGGRGAGHVGDDGRVGVHGLDALRVAAGELADQRDVHAAHEAHGARLARHRGGHADEVGAFVLLEEDREHVRMRGGVDEAVDRHELHVREVGRDGRDRAGHREAGGDDGVEAGLGEAAERLFALGFRRDLDVAVVAAGLGLEALGPVEGGFVERLVELAAQIVDQRRVGVGRACRDRKRRCRAEKPCHVGHTILPVGHYRARLRIGPRQIIGD
jgi:hypothetical protein